MFVGSYLRHLCTKAERVPALIFGDPQLFWVGKKIRSE